MLETWKQEFEGKNICIWGYGIEGKATYRLIRSLFPDMEITIADGGKGLATAKETTEHTICLSDKDCDFSKFNLVMKAPGIVVPEGQSLDNISGEAQLFLKHYASKTIGITGTKENPQQHLLLRNYCVKSIQLYLLATLVLHVLMQLKKWKKVHMQLLKYLVTS